MLTLTQPALLGLFCLILVIGGEEVQTTFESFRLVFSGLLRIIRAPARLGLCLFVLLSLYELSARD
jgi:hypothetical protein